MIGGNVRHRRRFGRHSYFREWMAGRALRRRALDFAQAKPMVSIIGDHVSDSIRADGLYERDILEFLRDRILDLPRSREQVAIDVGANIGNHSLFLAGLFDRVIAFEPNPLARSLLTINLEINSVSNVDVRAVGLSDRTGEATLSFAYENLGGASAYTVREGVGALSNVQFVVGDDAIDPAMPVGLIKVDVEGAEEDVLKGLSRTIRTHRPIIMMEQWEEVIDARAGTSRCFTYLRELGYIAWEVRPARGFRGPLGKISSLVLGRTDQVAERVERLQKRYYPALFFMPRDA